MINKLLLMELWTYPLCHICMLTWWKSCAQPSMKT